MMARNSGDDLPRRTDKAARHAAQQKAADAENLRQKYPESFAVEDRFAARREGREGGSYTDGTR